MKITCISDLHGAQPKLPGADLLIIAGDLTAENRYQEYVLFAEWLRNQDYKEKIIIAGNHDNLIQNTDLASDVLYEFTYLCDSGTEINDLKIWGSPWTKSFKGMNPACMAFTLKSDERLKEKWELIPQDIDILVTHSPPFNIMDQVTKVCYNKELLFRENCGSFTLYNAIFNQKRFPKLKLHVFGHIHEGYGAIKEGIEPLQFVNASIMDECYDPKNKPINIELQ